MYSLGIHYVFTTYSPFIHYCIYLWYLGVQDDREGLFDTIQKSRNICQKRAYQCIKCMVQLFSKCKLAHQFLSQTEELKKKWLLAIDWLQDELDKVRYFVMSLDKL
jgi:hypothetical protein